MYLGVDYYPEQWGLQHLQEDLDRIVELGCNMIRIADFAWDIFEPVEGHYCFDFFDEVIQQAQKHHLQVMMCTPTATMPKWLYDRYPDIMAKDEQGNPIPFGGRRGYCYNSEVYVKKSLALIKQLARHYQDDPAIAIWQLDNEIGHEGSDMCYCENCRKGFQQYLQEKYQDIKQLNQRMGLTFWSQQLESFDQIYLPKKAYTAQNPTLRLEWERFRDLSIQKYLQACYQQLKEVNPQAVVLHDLEGGTLTKHFNPYPLARGLDDIAYNNYPIWGGLKEPLKPWEVAFNLDMARGLRKERFWITEEIMGAQGHDIIGRAPRPQQGSCWAMQAFAHGCKSMLIFRYRGFHKGAEQYCYGILDADNRKRRKFYEVKELFQKVKEYQELFQTPIHAPAAIVYDYDSAASFRIQRQSDRFDYVQQMIHYHRQFWLRDLMVDVISSDDDLMGYQWVVVPSMIVMKPAYKEKLKQYVAAGGTLVLTTRTAYKDEDNNLIFGQLLPAQLDDLVGAYIEEQESLLEDQFVELPNGKGYYFAEFLQTTTAKNLMEWCNHPFGSYSAVTVNEYGKGKCYYFGSVLDDDTTQRIFDEITQLPVKKTVAEETVVLSAQSKAYQIHIDYDKCQYHIQENK